MRTVYFKFGWREEKSFFCVNLSPLTLFQQELATLKPHSLQNTISKLHQLLNSYVHCVKWRITKRPRNTLVHRIKCNLEMVWISVSDQYKNIPAKYTYWVGVEN